jgi:hypothetical protein
MLDTPAFPLAVLDQGDSGNLMLVEFTRGMTMFDYFAGQALAGLSANVGTIHLPPLEVAKRALAIADAITQASRHFTSASSLSRDVDEATPKGE